jgi:hypothetical protein
MPQCTPTQHSYKIKEFESSGFFLSFFFGEKGDLLHSSGHAVGRGKVNPQPIFSHLQGADMSL